MSNSLVHMFQQATHMSNNLEYPMDNLFLTLMLPLHLHLETRGMQL